MALCVWRLTAPQDGWGWFVVTLIGAVTAALSTLGGLAVFVAFTPAVVSKGYKKTLIWFAVAAAVIVPYMQGFPHSTPIHISVTTLTYCFVFLETTVGAPSMAASLEVGAISLALFIVNVAYYWFLEKRITPLLPWIGIEAYTVGVAVMTAFGRVGIADWPIVAMTSRYRAFAAMWWVAVIYLLMLNARSAFDYRSRLASMPTTIARISPWLVGANVLMLVSVTWGLATASLQSISAMEMFQYGQVQNQACVVNANYATTPCLWEYYTIPYL